MDEPHSKSILRLCTSPTWGGGNESNILFSNANLSEGGKTLEHHYTFLVMMFIKERSSTNKIVTHPQYRLRLSSCEPANRISVSVRWRKAAHHYINYTPARILRERVQIRNLIRAQPTSCRIRIFRCPGIVDVRTNCRMPAELLSAGRPRYLTT